MSSAGRVLAVDLGATSIRVAAVDLGARRPDIEILHRRPNAPVRAPDGSLRWDWDGIVSDVEVGLAKGLATGPVASIGVDGWGVDYGLVDREGVLVAPPWSYRDGRTGRWQDTADAVGPAVLYGITGIQMLPFNTVFQLAVHDPAELARAERVLLLPDLLVHRLTGRIGAERSNASTTGLMDAGTGDWSPRLVEATGLDGGLLPPVEPAGRPAGRWRGIPVHLVGSHDTASAFVAMPGGTEPGSVFVSAGTWAVVGTERAQPDTSERARAANFSNEAGALGGVRFVKNVPGFWILERCRASWGDPPMTELVEEAATVAGATPIFDTDAERFLAPEDMEAEVRAVAGLDAGAGRAVVVRVVLDSIAAGVAAVVHDVADVTGISPRRVAIVGGGARIAPFTEMVAAHTGLPVVRGTSEATALGNAMVQGIAIGRFDGLDDARAWLATSDDLV